MRVNLEPLGSAIALALLKGTAADFPVFSLWFHGRAASQDPGSPFLGAPATGASSRLIGRWVWLAPGQEPAVRARLGNTVDAPSQGAPQATTELHGQRGNPTAGAMIQSQNDGSCKVPSAPRQALPSGPSVEPSQPGLVFSGSRLTALFSGSLPCENPARKQSGFLPAVCCRTPSRTPRFQRRLGKGG